MIRGVAAGAALCSLFLMLTATSVSAGGNDYTDQNSYVGWKDEYVKKSTVERKEDFVKKS